MKRNIFLSVFLPLFLCAAILTLGYFSPMLFSRVMPNFKNKESAAQITGAESPLYLEDPSSLVLPPWNEIDTSKSSIYANNDNATPNTMRNFILQELNINGETNMDNWLYQLSNELSDQKTYIEVSDAYVRSIIQPFLKGCNISPNLKFSGLMHTYDPFDDLVSIPKYVYAQDVTVTTVQGRDFKVDFAFTPQSGIPLYVHATEIDKETASLPDNEAFMDIAGASLTMYFYCSDMRYSETEFDKIFQDFYGSSDVSGNSSAYYDVYEAILRLPDELFSSFISENDSLRSAEWTSKLFTRLSNTTLDIWYGFCYDLDSHYGIDYNNESLLVVRNSEGCTFTLTYDAISKSVTGFGFDPDYSDAFDNSRFLLNQTYWINRDSEAEYSSP